MNNKELEFIIRRLELRVNYLEMKLLKNPEVKTFDIDKFSTKRDKEDESK